VWVEEEGLQLAKTGIKASEIDFVVTCAGWYIRHMRRKGRIRTLDWAFDALPHTTWQHGNT
jgi:hypothetical protein